MTKLMPSRGMKHIRTNISRIKGYFLILLFIGYYGSITLFYHAHLVNNQIIVHSHPYKHHPLDHTPFESHSHTASAYSLIKQLNEPGWENAPDIARVPEPIAFFCSYFIDYIQLNINTNNCLPIQLRAPPSFYSFLF